MTDCMRRGLFGRRLCYFEPRYDVIPPTMSTMGLDSIKTTVGGMETMIQAMTKSIYIQDVCVRCGAVVQRAPVERTAKP